MAEKRALIATMAICPHCGQEMPRFRPRTLSQGELERLGEVRAKINRMLAQPDPLEGLPARAKAVLTEMGMADAPEKIARALQYRLLTRQTRGIGDITYGKIERWLEKKGLVRVSEEENFFWKGSKKWLT